MDAIICCKEYQTDSWGLAEGGEREEVGIGGAKVSVPEQSEPIWKT